MIIPRRPITQSKNIILKSINDTFANPALGKATRPCRIYAQASVLPPTMVSNAEIISTYGHQVTDKVIQRMVGVHTRYVASPDQSDTDLLVQAARQCLQQADIPVQRLSKIIVNKFLGDRILPPTAALLQRKLASPTAIQCLDIDGGTHSFFQALETGAKCIQSGDDYILIASGGVCNPLVSRSDPRVAFLFGDGATAVLLGPAQKQHFAAFYNFSNPAFSHLHCAIRFQAIANKSLRAAHSATPARDLLQMGNWKESLSYILEAAQTTMQYLLKHTHLTVDQIERFLVTETNGPLWRSILNHLKIPEHKTISLLQTQGNTLSANLPMLWCAAEKDAPLHPGQHTLMLSIGEGICGGGLIYRT